MDTNKAMANIMRILVLVFVIAYVIAPIDLAPGPIDDIIIAVLGVAYNRRLAAASNGSLYNMIHKTDVSW